MSNLEVLSYAAVTVGVLVYAAIANRSAFMRWLLPSPPAAVGDDWTKKWLNVLLDLKADLEKEGNQECVVLVRELLWRMVGGKPHDIAAKGDK
jgi:hypothetical protein